MSKVLIAIVSDPKRNDANLGCVTSLLRLQSHLMTAKGISVSITFSHDLPTVIDTFHKQSFDQLIYIDTMLGFNHELVLRMIQSKHDVIIGAYPLPKLFWDNVDKNMRNVVGDDIKNAALIFNVDVDTDVLNDGYALVKAVRDGEIGIFKATRRVVEETPTPFDPIRGWKGPVYADTRHLCTSFGLVDYIGCVGYRSLVR